MTVKQENDIDTSKPPTMNENEIAVVAQPVGPAQSGVNEPPIPAGHARFYCNKCHTPYDLPDKATSWRCANCMEFNSITPGECPWCVIS